MSVHVLDVARWLMGEVERLTCRTARVKRGIAGEDAAAILCNHASGVASVVDCSYATRVRPDPFPQMLVEIDGTEGSIRLAPGFRMTVTTGDQRETRDGAPGCPVWAEPAWNLPQKSVVHIQRHWIECLRADREPDTFGRNNLRTFALDEAVHASAAGGEVVVPQALAP